MHNSAKHLHLSIPQYLSGTPTISYDKRRRRLTRVVKGDSRGTLSLILYLSLTRFYLFI